MGCLEINVDYQNHCSLGSSSCIRTTLRKTFCINKLFRLDRIRQCFVVIPHISDTMYIHVQADLAVNKTPQSVLKPTFKLNVWCTVGISIYIIPSHLHIKPSQKFFLHFFFLDLILRAYSRTFHLNNYQQYTGRPHNL